MTYRIESSRAEFLPGDTLPTNIQIEDLTYYCDYECAQGDVLGLLEGAAIEGDALLGAEGGRCWRPLVGGLTAWDFLPDVNDTVNEVDYIVCCEACGTPLNATQIESFDTGRRTVEAGMVEVILWALDRGFGGASPEDHEIMNRSDDFDFMSEPDHYSNTGYDKLHWLFESAEQFFGELDGYRFDQDGDTGTTTLWSRDPSDPAYTEKKDTP